MQYYTVAVEVIASGDPNAVEEGGTTAVVECRSWGLTKEEAQKTLEAALAEKFKEEYTDNDNRRVAVERMMDHRRANGGGSFPQILQWGVLALVKIVKIRAVDSEVAGRGRYRYTVPDNWAPKKAT